MWEILIPVITVLAAILFALASYCMARSYPVSEDCTDVKEHIRSINKGCLALMACFSMFALTLLFVLFVMYIIQKDRWDSWWQAILLGATPFIVFWLPTYTFLLGMNRHVKACGD